MFDCYFCNRVLTGGEIRRGNICTRCSDERNGLRPSKSQAFLAAHPELRAFREAFTGPPPLAPDPREEVAERAFAFNRARMREKHRNEMEHGPIRLGRLYAA